MSLRFLHVLDHSIPLHSGFTFRTLSILREQRKLDWGSFPVRRHRPNGAARCGLRLVHDAGENHSPSEGLR